MSTDEKKHISPNGDSKKERKGKKDAQLLIRIQAAERDEFISLCEELDTTAARELRRFIRHFIKEHRDA